jgi:hypothetical protein
LTSYNITVTLFHPSGSATVNDLLTCGWHDSCIPGPNGGPALDWRPANCDPGGSCHHQSTWSRLFAVGVGPTRTWVARQESYYQETPCKQVRADIERISDWARYGTVHQYHSGGNTNHSYSNIYASTAGVQNAAVTGYILSAGDNDNCVSTGDHTHQWYEPGPYEMWHAKNSVSAYNTCNGCMTPFGIWSTYEYGFQFATG